MKLSKIVLSLGCLYTLFSGTVYADPVTVNGGTVHFKGELVNAACAVSIASSDQVVQLGQHRTASFSNVADTSSLRPFRIILNDCDNSIAETASVTFSGVADLNNPDLLAVTSDGGATPATGVGIEILDMMGTPLLPNVSWSTPHNLLNGSNTLDFTARYKATAATTTAGMANADATFVMKYE
ncbi:type-1 fimbrial protein subunit A [Chania multitudinisentens RB-25]|uniref:Type-1 fimbrial protein subunit A n=1 Tax=Chania multitudinisentens RB-25 TaxID=1441930 RepID=W0LF30_9GAMM|nr:type 1 fimbrial major subunit FimA [Chania multitudinisentens]AHG20867.1 type-1 fimbrial protein subunit A [Chania multitudinisentens RB-25]